MSTSPDPSERPEDALVSLISHWLARHLGNKELFAGLQAVDTSELAPGQAAVVGELLEELRSRHGRGELEMVARETLEALALGH
ncbi:MAG: hypothetical protein ACRDN6_06100 [Gaiellaceae bacterium]